MSFPDFFILGAPKCGTTALAHWLGEHPQVYMSPVKEPHYFNTDMANRTITSREQYEKLFRGVKPEQTTVGEASTWYLFSQEAVPNIEQECPNAKYIVMTRDPVEMAHSLYHHNYRALHEDQPTFEQAWVLQEERAAGRVIPKTCNEPAFLQYQSACSLGSLLERLYGQVQPSRVLHLSMQGLRNDPASEYCRVQRFLGVHDENRTDFASVNVARSYRSWALQRVLRFGGRARKAIGIHRGLGLMRLNEREQVKAPLSEGFREELVAAFKSEYEKLERLRELYGKKRMATSDASSRLGSGVNEQWR